MKFLLPIFVLFFLVSCGEDIEKNNITPVNKLEVETTTPVQKSGNTEANKEIKAFDIPHPSSLPEEEGIKKESESSTVIEKTTYKPEKSYTDNSVKPTHSSHSS